MYRKKIRCKHADPGSRIERLEDPLGRGFTVASIIRLHKGGSREATEFEVATWLDEEESSVSAHSRNQLSPKHLDEFRSRQIFLLDYDFFITIIIWFSLLISPKRLTTPPRQQQPAKLYSTVFFNLGTATASQSRRLPSTGRCTCHLRLRRLGWIHLWLRSMRMLGLACSLCLLWW